MKDQNGFTAIELAMVIVFLCVIIPGIIGWIMNVSKLASCDFEAPYKAEIIHGVGIIPVVGAITGYMVLGN